VNAVGFLGLAHQASSHVTGILAISGIEAARGDVVGGLQALASVALFLLGAVLGGAIIGDATLKAGRRYGVALILESALLWFAMYFFAGNSLTGERLSLIACGLQNAMATSYSGAVLRTTHMTGVVTDMGVLLGQALVRHKVDWFRFRLLLVLVGGFFSGTVMGGSAYLEFGTPALAVPASLSGGFGVAYMIWIRVRAARGPQPHEGPLHRDSPQASSATSSPKA
jgi:uncharacterized membrane protein YoaK (UPF0700 family)